MKKFLKKLLILTAVILFTSLTVFAKDSSIKFVQITDAHLSAKSDYSINVLKSAVEDINNQSGISFVIFTGDNINEAKPENLKKFMEIVSKLKVPYYIAVGNHDVYKSANMSKAEYYSIIREKNPFYIQKSANYKFSKNGFVFLIADGAKEVIPGAAGYYKEDTLKWIDKNLTKNSKKPVIIFQHFPIEYPTGAERRLKTHQTYKVEEYKKILEKHNNVLAILSGHFHVNYETMKDGVYHISTPTLLVVPQSYKIIDIVTTKDFSPIIYTQLKEFKLLDQSD